MFLPDKLGLFVIALISAICWGSWVNTVKLLSNIRIELYYMDYTLGMFLTAVILVTVLGGDFIGDKLDGKNFPTCLYGLDNIRVIYALAAGVTFNFGNFLLVCAIRIAGLAISLPAGIGISFAVATIVKLLEDTDSSNPLFLFSGLALNCMAITCSLFVLKFREQENGHMNEPLLKNSSMTKEKFESSFCYGVSICILCGLLLGAWGPLESEALKSGEGQLSAYTGYFFFSLAVLITTFPICSISSKKPIFGSPFSTRSEYTKGGYKWHLLAVFGGVTSSLGTLFNLLSTQTASSQGQNEYIYVDAIGHISPIIAAFWGIFIWKEFKNPSWIIIILLVLTILLYVGSIVLISLGNASMW